MPVAPQCTTRPGDVGGWEGSHRACQADSGDCCCVLVYALQADVKGRAGAVWRADWGGLPSTCACC